MMNVGEIVAGKYRVDRVIGRGGMGVVVAAQHLQLPHQVALKSLLPEAAGEPAIFERFVREARASSQLRGEHVCRVSDVGALDNGAPYFVMELLEGQDLASVLATHGPLPVALAVDYVLQACLGVAEAHALGVIHRDLKPANLFLTQRPDGTGLIKVLDFGIARSRSDVAADLTQAHAVLGSPGYMSPEQLRSSREVDVRSDIWGLGVILYELVSGVRPFSGGSITEIAVRVTLDPPPLLSVSLPPRFHDVILRCLEKDPARRFPHLAALASALADFGRPDAPAQAAAIARVLNPQPSPTGPEPQIADPAGVPVTLPPTILPVLAPRMPRRRWHRIAAAVTAFTVGAVGAILLVTRAASPDEDRRSSTWVPPVIVPPRPAPPRPAPPEAAIEAAVASPSKHTAPISPMRRARPVIKVSRPGRVPAEDLGGSRF